VECFRALGYRVHSCKVGADVDLDIARIEALAAARAPEETIFYDVNRAWLPWEAITVMNRLQGLPGFFEQPCETFAESAQVRAHTSQPISLDEGIKTFDDLQYAQEQGLCEIVNIKIGRVGGLTKARLMRDFCLAKGMAMLIMETGGTVVADTAVAHLSQSIPAESCLGTWSCQEMITPDPARGLGARNEAGCLTLPDAPGLGVAPAADFLGEPSAVYS
jgi:L-alanine-DL-glutamate epimerase-like enolase superfamily enzyme